MKSEKDIFDNIGKASFGVPEGYFNDLKVRLESIPERGKVLPGPWSRVKPFLAMAASFAAILLIGNSVLRHTVSSQTEEPSLNESSYAEMISLTHPEAFMNALEYEGEDMTEEDIINYLIESGMSMEYLAYSGDQKN